MLNFELSFQQQSESYKRLDGNLASIYILMLTLYFFLCVHIFICYFNNDLFFKIVLNIDNKITDVKTYTSQHSPDNYFFLQLREWLAKPPLLLAINLQNLHLYFSESSILSADCTVMKISNDRHRFLLS